MDTTTILSRIRKLLALANGRGATPEEAANAAARAQALMEEHDITQADVAQADAPVNPLGTQSVHFGKLWLWQSILWKGVADTTSCAVVWNPRAKVLTIVGREANVAACRELYAFLDEQVRHQARAFSQRQVPGGDFQLGCASRVQARLMAAWQARQDARPEANALALVSARDEARAALEAVVNTRNSKPRRTVRDAAAYWAGEAAGDKVRLNVERKLAKSQQVFLA